MSEDMKELVRLVRLLIDDAGAYHSALELWDLDGVDWCSSALELLNRLEVAA
ncbi:hypothetical protein VL73_61 [Erwinia phage VL73]